MQDNGTFVMKYLSSKNVSCVVNNKVLKGSTSSVSRSKAGDPVSISLNSSFCPLCKNPFACQNVKCLDPSPHSFVACSCFCFPDYLVAWNMLKTRQVENAGNRAQVTGHCFTYKESILNIHKS